MRLEGWVENVESSVSCETQVQGRAVFVKLVEPDTASRANLSVERSLGLCEIAFWSLSLQPFALV